MPAAWFRKGELVPMFKSLISGVAVLSAASICLTPGDAIGGSTAVGSACEPYAYQLATPPAYQVQTNAINHGLYAADAQLLGVTCPIPIETTLGATVTFRVRVGDGSDMNPVTCYGSAYNQNGDAIGTTSAMTTSAAGTGTSTLTATLAVSPQSSSYTYGVNCTLPGNPQSAVKSVRVY
jgi:hypothetical protein